jgi:hypothetical protein
MFLAAGIVTKQNVNVQTPKEKSAEGGSLGTT